MSPVHLRKLCTCVYNQNRPDKAYTTERAKKAGKANAASGKIFVTVPPDHFGPILAENDPERNRGVLAADWWEDRFDCRQWGVHRPLVSGICGQLKLGAQSVVLSGGYEDDEYHGEWFLFTGRDLMEVIEGLQHKTEDEDTIEGSGEAASDSLEKRSGPLSGIKENDTPHSQGEELKRKKNDASPVIEEKPGRTCKRKKIDDGDGLSKIDDAGKENKEAEEATDVAIDSPSSPLHVRSDNDFQ